MNELMAIVDQSNRSEVGNARIQKRYIVEVFSIRFRSVMLFRLIVAL